MSKHSAPHVLAEFETLRNLIEKPTPRLVFPDREYESILIPRLNKNIKLHNLRMISSIHVNIPFKTKNIGDSGIKNTQNVNAKATTNPTEVVAVYDENNPLQYINTDPPVLNTPIIVNNIPLMCFDL